MIRLCTIIDQEHAAQGAALLRSIRKYMSDAQVSILALDQFASDAFCRLRRARSYPALKIVPLAHLEHANPAVRAVRAHRAWRYYVSSLVPVFLDYVIRDGHDCCYLDPECFFFDDPARFFRFEPHEQLAIIRAREREHVEDSLSGHDVCAAWFRGASPHAERLRLEWAMRCMTKCDTMTCGNRKHLEGIAAANVKAVHLWDDPGFGLEPQNLRQWAIVSGDPPKLVSMSDRREYRIVLFRFCEFSCHEPRRHMGMLDGADYGMSNQRLSLDACAHLYGPYLHAISAAISDLAATSRRPA